MNPDLAPQRLLAAYATGIFPMADEEGELHWLCPDPRCILEFESLTVSRSLRATLRRNLFHATVNRAFDRVMSECADRSEGTWISDEIKRAYGVLHQLGFAHSLEVWKDDELAGGLYGVAIGGVFFGESMFFRNTDASKIALVRLVERLGKRGFELLDVQFITDHLQRLGATEIPRKHYLQRLERAVNLPRSFDEESDDALTHPPT